MQDNSKQNPQKKNQDTLSQTADGMNRREALVKLGKLAVYTTPVMTTLIISNEAEAQFGSPPPPPVNNPFPPVRPTGNNPFPNTFPPKKKQ